jgi:hypothetical protein
MPTRDAALLMLRGSNDDLGEKRAAIATPRQFSAETMNSFRRSAGTGRRSLSRMATSVSLPGASRIRICCLTCQSDATSWCRAEENIIRHEKAGSGTAPANLAVEVH